MAFDFDNEVKTCSGQPIDHKSKDMTTAIAKHYHTDSSPVGDNTGREYLEGIGYFDVAEKFYMVDPKPYLRLCPDAVVNFGVIILEPGRHNKYFFTDEVLTKPQLVFQQVCIEITPEGVVERPKGRLLHVFKGIYRVTKDAEGKYHLSKLWDKFIFNPKAALKTASVTKPH